MNDFVMVKLERDERDFWAAQQDTCSHHVWVVRKACRESLKRSATDTLKDGLADAGDKVSEFASTVLGSPQSSESMLTDGEQALQHELFTHDYASKLAKVAFDTFHKLEMARQEREDAVRAASKRHAETMAIEAKCNAMQEKLDRAMNLLRHSNTVVDRVCCTLNGMKATEKFLDRPIGE